MSLWSALSDLLSKLPLADSVGSLVDRVVEVIRSLLPTEQGRQVAFTIAMIALAAKMAKADGVVTADEVSVVKRLFVVPDEERGNVARLFNLAKQDVAGFEAYAARIESLNRHDPAMLEDILDGLFVIADADGVIHERELAFLRRVAEIFSLSTAAFARISARHIRPDAADPYVILGVPRGAGPDEVKRAWRRQVIENHPDRLIARGVPPDCVRLATDRMAAINAAYERIERELV